jgi:hypothetical protein
MIAHRIRWTLHPIKSAAAMTRRRDTPPASPLGRGSSVARMAGLCGQCSDTIAQRLNLEHEIHHAAAKLGILGFEQLK